MQVTMQSYVYLKTVCGARNALRFPNSTKARFDPDNLNTAILFNRNRRKAQRKTTSVCMGVQSISAFTAVLVMVTFFVCKVKLAVSA